MAQQQHQHSTVSSSTSLQETQFAPPGLVDAVLGGAGRSQDYIVVATADDSDDYLLEDGNAGRGKDTYLYDPDNVLLDQHREPLSLPLPLPLPAPAPSTASPRVIAPDLLRGLLMALQALDHAAVFSGGYSHGQAIVGETASTRLTRWSEPVSYAARTLTHLCAPGFLFLLGMGIVYFGRSRAKLGWSATRMARHFFVRGLVLIAVNEVIGIVVMRRVLPIINIVLLALAFNYFLAGMVWLTVNWTEPRVAKLVAKLVPDSSQDLDGETQSLLHADSSRSTARPTVLEISSRLSFHAHNVFLLALSLVTIWWNIWLDPHHGRCPSPSSTEPDPEPLLTNPLAVFLFYFMKSKFIFSGFPPLAWLSPALLGLLYGRIVLSRPWKPIQINVANLLVGLTFAFFFVLTRLYQFGNLDTACLAMPEHLASHHQGKPQNQYLASARSFFYVTKYPPSPSFLFYTMGTNFLLLSFFGIVPSRLIRFFPLSPLLVFGTSALFFYVAHLPLYNVLGELLKQLFGHQLDWDNPMTPGKKAWGIGMGVLFWADWIVGLTVLWPLCRWYGRFKAGKGVDSIWRFF